MAPAKVNFTGTIDFRFEIKKVAYLILIFI